MLKSIERLIEQTVSDSLETSPRTWADQMVMAVDAGLNLMTNLHESPPWMEQRSCAKPDVGQQVPLNELLNILCSSVLPTGSNHRSSKNFSFFVSGGLPQVALAKVLAVAANSYSGKHESAPGSVELEDAVLRWFVKLFSFPERSAYGSLMSGGSLATFAAIVVARDYRSGVGPRHVVYMTKLAHGCVRKALRLAGLRDIVVREIAVDTHLKMDVRSLAKAVSADRAKGFVPWLVVGTAGTTLAGSIDPLVAIRSVADQEGLWMHVDAAYGGMFILTESGCEKLAGISEADSLVVNPHKGLFLPHGSGLLLVRDVELLRSSFDCGVVEFRSKEDAPGFIASPASVSPELTRPFRGLDIWVPLALYGLRPFQATLHEKLLLAQWLFEAIREIPGFSVGPRPDLSVVLFRVDGRKGEDLARINSALLAFLLSEGFRLNSVEWDGRPWLRVAILNYRSHLGDLRQLVTCLGEYARMSQSADERPRSGIRPHTQRVKPK